MKAKHPSTHTFTMSRPLELLHLDLMGPTRTESLDGKRYIMVVVYLKNSLFLFFLNRMV